MEVVYVSIHAALLASAASPRLSPRQFGAGELSSGSLHVDLSSLDLKHAHARETSSPGRGPRRPLI